MATFMSNLSPAPFHRDTGHPLAVDQSVVAGINPKTSRPRTGVMGGRVDVMTGAEILGWVQYAARGRRKAVVGTHNLRSLFLAERHPQMARFYDLADIVQMNSLLLLKFAAMTGKPLGPEHLSAYPHWRDQFWSMCQRYGLRVYYLGGDAGVATGAIRMLEMAYPDVRFSGRDRYFDETSDGAENQQVISAIRKFAPDILLVGLGMPRQEIWIAENYSDLPPCVIMPVGEALDRELGETGMASDKTKKSGIKDTSGGGFYELCCLIKPAVLDILKRRQ